MKQRPGNLAHLLRDQAGQAQIEWVLLLVGFGLPFIAVVFAYLLPALAEYYRLMIVMETLPFP